MVIPYFSQSLSTGYWMTNRVACSGGGPYALATAYYLPDRVRGVLLISPASDYSAHLPSASHCLHNPLYPRMCLNCSALGRH